MASNQIPTLRLAVCLFPDVTALDYQGPMELLGCLSPDVVKRGISLHTPPLLVEVTYLSHNKDPVKPLMGPLVLPNASYDDMDSTNQFDIIVVPGGPGVTPDACPKSLTEFLKRQAPGAKHILTICTGSWPLARAGILNGKKATTNKSLMKVIMEDTKDLPITWIKKARWVVNDDKKIWTSSGVTAGQDMGGAFLEHLIGKPAADTIRNIVELSTKGEEDDEFAEVYGL